MVRSVTVSLTAKGWRCSIKIWDIKQKGKKRLLIKKRADEKGNRKLTKLIDRDWLGSIRPNAIADSHKILSRTGWFETNNDATEVTLTGGSVEVSYQLNLVIDEVRYQYSKIREEALYTINRYSYADHAIYREMIESQR